MRQIPSLRVIALAALAALGAATARAQVRAGPEFRVNTYTTEQQSIPSVAAEPGGGFVAVWASYTQDEVVGGCSTNPPLYCPTASVTREQMGVFLTVTFGLKLYGG